MADPARIKPEDKPERTASAKEEHLKTEVPENVPVSEKAADGDKESSSQDLSKQEVKAVSSFTVLFEGF